MPLPPTPRSGFQAIAWAKRLTEWVRSTRPVAGPGIRLRQSPSGTIISAVPGKGGRGTPVVLPFQISATSDSIRAEPGTIDSTFIDEVVESAPADGIWYLHVKITTDNASGIILSEEVVWSQTLPSNTATEFYRYVGEITVTDGVPDPSMIVQANYGPFSVLMYGVPEDVWAASII